VFWILIGLVGFAYLGYPLLLAALVRVARRQPKSDDVTPSVTLLIPAYNEERSLGPKLDSCLGLDYPSDQLQIIVLSDGSTDQTNAVAARYVEHGIELMAFEANRGKLAVLRDGVEHARGEIVAFSDAACRLMSDSIRRLARPFADPDVGCVSGVYRVLRPEAAQLGDEEGFYWKYETFIKRCESDLASILGAHGSLYAIRRELCPDLTRIRINDDYEIPVKIVAGGHRAVYAPDAVACEEATEMGGFARRVRIAVGNFRQLRLLGLLLWPPRPWLLFQFVSHKVLRLIGPFCLAAALALNAFLTGALYMALLVAQVGFYGLALAGWLGGGRRARVPLLKLPYYFCMINAAYVVGLARLLVGRRALRWNAPRPWAPIRQAPGEAGKGA
jgi:cellulose synthase/poly-beta-1,6-N-acetylglucosamine synthase-like glycosyltransferase